MTPIVSGTVSPCNELKSRCTPTLQKAPQKALYQLAMCLEERLAPHRIFEHEKNIPADIPRIWMMEKIYTIAPAPRVRGLVVTNPHFYNMISYNMISHSVIILTCPDTSIIPSVLSA